MLALRRQLSTSAALTAHVAADQGVTRPRTPRATISSSRAFQRFHRSYLRANGSRMQASHTIV